MSYDKSKLFSGNETGKIMDDFPQSPAFDDNYDYMKCIVKVMKLNNEMGDEPRPKSYPRGKVNNMVTASEKRGSGY